MKTQLDRHIDRLRDYHGSYSQAARAIGLNVRTFRRGRNSTMPRPAKTLIITAGRLLVMRLLVRELVKSGAVSPQALICAWRKVFVRP